MACLTWNNKVKFQEINFKCFLFTCQAGCSAFTWMKNWFHNSEVGKYSSYQSHLSATHEKAMLKPHWQTATIPPLFLHKEGAMWLVFDAWRTQHAFVVSRKTSFILVPQGHRVNYMPFDSLSPYLPVDLTTQLTRVGGKKNCAYVCVCARIRERERETEESRRKLVVI